MAPPVSSTEVPKKVVHQALRMAFGTFASRILGLLRDMALAALFSRTVTDAWTAAFRLPNLFRRLFGEGSLAVSFIPVYVEARGESRDRAQALANGFYTLLLVFLALLTGLGLLCAEPLMRLLLSAEYGAEKLELTVRLARIMLGFVFFVTTYAYFMGILNALGSFALPALAPTLFNVSMIVSTLLPGRLFSGEGDGLAWGVLVGGALQALILVPPLVKLGALPRLRWQGLSADIRHVLRNLGPGLLGLGLLQFTTLVNLKYASGLGEGAISYIYWADRLLELPLSLISVSLGTALLPTLSLLWSQGQKEQMSKTAETYLRLNLFIALPASLGLYFLALPIVEVLFMRGRFSGVDAEATAAVLRVYAGLLLATSGVRVLVPAYYATKNTWFPALASGASLLLHVVLAPVLMQLWGLEGLVLSATGTATLNLALLLGFYPRWIGAFDYASLLTQGGRFVFAGIGMAVVLQMHPFLTALLGTEGVARALSLALTILAGAGAYFALSFLLQVEELQFLKKSTSRSR